MVNPNVRAKIVQYMAGCCASLALMSVGIIYTWINPVLPILLSSNSPVQMSSIQASCIASLPDIGGLVTTIPGGFLADAIGRKTLLLCATPFTLIGWIIIYFTSNVYLLMVARLLQGFSVGLWCTAFPLYLSEIAEPSVRGSLGNLYVIAFTLGQLYVFAIGPHVAYTTLAAVGTIPSGALVISFVWFHESPYFLFMKGKYEKAKISLHSFRGGEGEEEEFNRIKKVIEEEKSRDDNWKVAINTYVGRKALFVTSVISMSVFLGGFTVLLSYSSVIFYETIKTDLQPHIFTLIMGVLVTISAIFCSLILDLWGRRPTMLLSQCGNCVCLIFAAVYFLSKQWESKVEKLGLITVLAIILSSICSLFGMCTIKVYQAEVFSTASRGFGTGINTFLCSVSSALALIMFIPLKEQGFIYINFFVFSTISLIGAIVIYLEAPETKGQPLEQIQENLKRRIH